jgi:NAD(P)-dependent dehydrogenase (short-subunit alcohol dehydrogenase family)
VSHLRRVSTSIVLIILTTGAMAKKPMPGRGLAGLSSAIGGITRGLAVDLAPNVRVNCVAPGFVSICQLPSLVDISNGSVD